MKTLHFIPHVNRPDLTIGAIKSVPSLWKHTIVIDNSNNDELSKQISKEINQLITIKKPPVPLTTAQTYNWIRSISIEEKTDFITFMHNDCEVITHNGDVLLVEAAKTAFTDTTKKIGWIHQDANENEDLFCAYKTEMLEDVGEWDWLCFPFYFLDIDYMRRVKNRGWTIQKTSGILCEHHSGASSTIKSSKLRSFINPYYFSISQTLMNIKWSKLNGDWSNL